MSIIMRKSKWERPPRRECCRSCNVATKSPRHEEEINYRAAREFNRIQLNKVGAARTTGEFLRRCRAAASGSALLLLLIVTVSARADETNVMVTAYTNTAADGALRITTHVATNIVSEWDLVMQGKRLWGASVGDSLPALFNRAEFQVNHGYCQVALPLLTLIEQRFDAKALRAFQRDGCSGQFLLEAAFCRAYRLAGEGPNSTNYALAYDYGMRARKRMQDGSGGGNARRYALLLFDLAYLPERAPGQSREFRAQAFELQQGLSQDMINLREQYIAQRHPAGIARARAFAQLLTAAPYYQASTYSRCGTEFAMAGEHREAFNWWIRSFKYMQPIEFYSHAHYIPRDVYEWFAFATEDEVRAYQEAVRRMPARFPATTRNVAEIAQWLQCANDKRVQFELEVRAAEHAGDAALLTNLWLRGAREFANVWYAARAGDYASWTRHWCDQMRSETWPYMKRDGEPCAAQRVEQYLDKLDPDSLRMYRATLQRRADQFRTHENEKVKAMVAKLDARCKELDKLLAVVPANATTTNRIE